MEIMERHDSRCPISIYAEDEDGNQFHLLLTAALANALSEGEWRARLAGAVGDHVECGSKFKARWGDPE